MTEYAVTVQYTGDFLVEAESASEAEEHVKGIMGFATPDSDWYSKEILAVEEES